MRRINFIFLACGLLLSACQTPTPPGAAVATAHPLATQAGLDILAAGGNAFDAAVAISATLAVVEPYSSGMGGGGFWLLHRVVDGKTVMIDGRETAPLQAQRDMYLDAQGEVIPALSVDGALAAGIPGQPAALVHIAQEYGRLPLAQSLAPAINAAQAGFEVTAYYQRMAGFRLAALRDSPAAAAVFLLNDDVPPLGYKIKQPDLARTLQTIARQGRAGFYADEVADRLVQGVRAAGGIWTRQDLQAYRVVERQPVSGSYRGYRITSAAPPSSGGVALLTMLNILENYDLSSLPQTQQQHLIIEAMRRAYRDRAEFLGDPDFVKVDVKRLTDKGYARQLSQSIDPAAATPSDRLPPAAPVDAGFHTTHFSVIDTQGNRVAATLSINYPFGSGFMPAGTGVLLNDEMDDFSAKPGAPNVYGLVGAEANAIAPGKRMLSSMSPTFMENDTQVVVLGTPGGSRIISMVLHGILAAINGQDARSIVSQPRYHHQYLPDVVQIEPEAVNEADRQKLQRMGHQLQALDKPYGNMQVVIWHKRRQTMEAASDPRGEGAARVMP